QFRHTYASQMLTAGVSVERIARKMGLTSTAMIYRHYGKWIVEDAPDYDAVEDTVLDRCFNGFTKLEPATIAKSDESHQCYGSDTANSTSKCDTRLCRLTVLFEYLDRLP
ncbi:site-specific integrase, partial [Aeromonas veronii]